jgi:uncharacterized protein
MIFWWSIVGLAIFLIGLSKSGFGSGMGLLVVPMMTLAMANIAVEGESIALGLMLPLLIVGDIIAVWQYRRIVSIQAIRQLLPGTLLGLIAGGSLLLIFQRQQADVTSALIRIVIGMESVVMVSLHTWRLWHRTFEPFVPRPWHSYATGAAAGISSTLAHAAGPVIALYLLPQGLDRRMFVGTCAIFFFILNIAKLPAYLASGMFTNASPLFALQFAPLVLAGGLFGVWLVRRISDTVFSRIIYAVTFLLGIYILADGILRLAAHL